MLVHAAVTLGSHDGSRWCLIGYVFFLGAVCAQFQIIQADCWYHDQMHDENSEVSTGEPCLNCTCSRSVLLCYLRVCPKLPDPPPPGCILLHRYRTCCPELICSDFYDGGNSLEARSDPEGGLDIPSDDQSVYENACISNGSIYGSGSAMHSSSLCEYCYCLAGKQICVKPKCLLPIEGCSPIFEDTSCCPVRYKCTLKPEETSTEHATTTVISTSTVAQLKDGCLADGIQYPEGSKVIGVGHSVCDNCYCLRGLLRCEPLSCAPPLLGCTPVVKPGQCCAASYNCNGTLEIEPEPNYGLFPTISKEYSKLRKEVHRKSPIKHKKDGVVTVEPFYVLAETLQDPTTKFVYQRSPDTYGTSGTTRHFSGGNFNPSSTQEPPKEGPSSTENNFYLISSSKQKSTTSKPILKHKTVPGIYYATTNYEFQNKNYKRVYSTTFRSNERSLPTKVHAKVIAPESKEDVVDASSYLGFENLNIFSIVDSLLDGKLYNKMDNQTEPNPVNEVLDTTETNKKPVYNYVQPTTETTTDYTTDIINLTLETTMKLDDAFTTSLNDIEPTTVATEKEVEAISLTDVHNNITTTLDDQTIPITLRSVMKSTDCINNVKVILEKDNQNSETTTVDNPFDPDEINKLAETRTEFLTTTDFDADDSSSENFLNKASLNTNSRKKAQIIDVSQLPSDIEAINHKNGDDFDYDYNEPTLPPSLPNLKIIPFVAADALDPKKEVPKGPTPIYVDKKMDDGHFKYSHNLFSPPVKTEGGFVPKEPSVLDAFYNDVVSAPFLTKEPIENVNTNCISEGQEIQHGMSVSSDSPCTTCTCFYGNIVCQKPNCPPPRPGCTKVVEQGVIILCCPNYVCGEPNLPTLDRHNSPQEIVTVAEGIIPPDPFKDVIRTEVAPNLQSLIGDMMSFQRTTSTTTFSSFKQELTTSEIPKLETTTPQSEDTFGLADVFKFIFSGGSDVPEKEYIHSDQIENVTEKQHSDGVHEAEAANFSENSPGVGMVSNGVFKVPSEYKTNKDSAPNIINNTKFETVKSNDTQNIDPSAKLNLLATTNRRKTTTTKFDDTRNSLGPSDKAAYNKNSENKNESNKSANVVGVGILKLAGCNIYGRMYRVGRIISELSGPCLECKCTDAGVQCRPLKC